VSKFAAGVRAHPWWSTLGVVALVVAGGAFAARDVIGLALTADEPVDLTLPLVTPLTPAAGETVYRIDAEHSMVTVGVKEVLAGVDNDVELTTRGIAGDVAVRGTDPTTGRLGEVQVDVHQLTSDNALRDKAIAHEYLETHNHRTVSLHDARIVDVDPRTDSEGRRHFGIDATLRVKNVDKPVHFDAVASVDGNELRATARARVKMSDYGVGPITKVGLVSTGNDVTVTLDLVAVDGRDFTPPTGLGTSKVQAAAGKGPSYARDVEPILAANCASCHQSGQSGAQSWTLDHAGDAAKYADGLAVVTKSKYMPPWPPSDKGVPLRHPRGLTTAQIDLLGRWAKAGAPLDVPAGTAVKPPAQPEVPTPRADVTMSASEPYVGDGTRLDEYRCFVLDPGFTKPAMVTGFAFHADQPRVVHHALVYRYAAKDRAKVDTMDASDPKSGFDCGGAMGTGGGELVGGWVPGQRPMEYENNTGHPFGAGDILVEQIHYHWAGVLVADRSGMSLEVAPDPTTVTPLRTRTLVAPVELPCPAGTDAPLCDRNAAIADANARFGGTAAFLANGLHRICGTTPEGVAALSDGFTARTVCDYPIRGAATIVDVLGHMHGLGTHYTMTLNPGRADEKVLLDIPVWNFAWQLNYQPVDPVPIKPGDTIRVECNWDRRLRYDPAPRYIFFAEGTNDEMCFSTVTTVAATPPPPPPG